MSTHVTGTFEIDNWDEKSYDVWGGTTLTRAHLKKSFRGDVEGESTTELFLTYTQEGSRRPMPASNGSSAASTAARAVWSCNTASPGSARSRNRWSR